MNYSPEEIKELIEELEQTKGWKIIVDEIVKYFKAVRNELEISTDDKDLLRKGELRALRFVLNLPEELKKGT
ncbi:MAG: hypothetical protein J7L34_00075 [Thermotogaceae bacterium]|nr:hypothetical protein [Thermotogaceae bacterium]